MLGSAFKISLRTLYREKRYAAINIAGLSLAMACVIILALYLRSELTYDQHWEGHQNIYRLEDEIGTNGVMHSSAYTGRMVGPMVAQGNPDIETVVRFGSNEALMLRHEGVSYRWQKIFFATPNMFTVFKHRILYGDPATALNDTSKVAVSETFARRYFGDANPVGELITAEDGREFFISLVFADPPENTHFTYDVLFSHDVNPDPTSMAQQERALFSRGFFTYLKMRPGYDPANWAPVSQALFDQHMTTYAPSINLSWRSWLQPLADVHLHSRVENDQPSGSLYAIYAFSAVAIFLLGVACINYMNLATARSAKRGREVGMRKILGSNRGALITQFLTESLLYCAIAWACSLVLVELIFYFTNVNELLGKSLSFRPMQEPGLILWSLLFTLALGLLAGLYPALYLSSWQPLTALVGNKNSGKTSATLRSALVFTQFTISVAVIACTILMAQQMRYVASKDLGFEKENKVALTLYGFNAVQRIPVLETLLQKNPNFLGATTVSYLPGGEQHTGIPMETMAGDIVVTDTNTIDVASDFVEVMKVELLQGRSFNQRLLTDVGTNAVVNESLVAMMGWGDQAVGKRIGNGRVIGVVKDFHVASLHTAIGPLLMRVLPDEYLANTPERRKPFVTENLVVSITGQDVSETIQFLEETITGYDPAHPFEFFFFDEALDELYQSEAYLMKLIGIFSGVCIFISCLGLYGLAAFTTEQRTREIGIRKVLGASSSQVIMLLSRNVLVLIIAGAIAASAVSYLVIDYWLTSFAYRTGIDPLAFVVSSGLVLVIAYSTIAMQSWRTAQSDPAESLRYE